MKILIALALFVSTFLMSCTNSSSSPGPKITVDGTSDSGGGNGIENKVYEAYIVKPENLNAFKNYIEPKFKQILSALPNGGKRDLLIRWLLYKTWYIAPVELKTISKEVIGVSFSNDQTEQLAIQTRKSVWIDSRKFNQMSQQDQALLIIHEMTMSLYYLKFKSWKEVCTEKLMYIHTQLKSCSDIDELNLLNSLFPGSEPKPFDSIDYENIRTVAGIFSGPLNFKSAADLDSILISNNFDRRFTASMGILPEDQDTIVKERVIYDTNVELKSEVVRQIFETAKILNNYPDTCKSINLKQTVDCQLKISETELTTKAGYKIKAENYSIHIPENVNFNNFSFVSNNSFMPTVTASSIEFVSLKKKLFFLNLLYPSPMPTPNIVGTNFRSGTILAVQDTMTTNATLTLLGIATIPGVIIGTDKETGNCTYSKPNPTMFDNDTILLYSKNLNSEDLNLLISQSLYYPNFTTCIGY